MEMKIFLKTKHIEVTLEKDESRGDIDIRIDGKVVGYFTNGVGTPTFRFYRAVMQEVGFVVKEVGTREVIDDENSLPRH